MESIKVMLFPKYYIKYTLFYQIFLCFKIVGVGFWVPKWVDTTQTNN